MTLAGHRLAQTLACRSARRRRNSHHDRRPEGSAPVTVITKTGRDGEAVWKLYCI